MDEALAGLLKVKAPEKVQGSRAEKARTKKRPAKRRAVRTPV